MDIDGAFLVLSAQVRQGVAIELLEQRWQLGGYCGIEQVLADDDPRSARLRIDSLNQSRNREQAQSQQQRDDATVGRSCVVVRLHLLFLF